MWHSRPRLRKTLNPFEDRGPQAPSPAKFLAYTNLKKEHSAPQSGEALPSVFAVSLGQQVTIHTDQAFDHGFRAEPSLG